jgi:predicted nucleic acid-binding Zn ribbon protein
MPQTLKEYGLEEKAHNYSVITEWPEIVGEKVAAVTIPEKLDRGILTVRVTSSVWKYELTMRKAEILRKIHAKYGDLSVREIHLK